jgi:uncharacterized membrane protein YagU involved in acid resistance
VTAVRILQGIASGALGPRAYTGGLATAALGVAFHYAIALIWTVVFFVACRTFRWLGAHPIPIGLAYGVVVWSVMNLVVLPLSNARRGPFNLSGAIIGAVILMFCIGLPIAAIVGRHFSRPFSVPLPQPR